MTSTLAAPVQLDMFAPAKPAQKCVGNVLMLGGGRQSSGLAEMSVTGDLPRFDLVLFADTGNEPDYVLAQVNYLRGRLATVSTPLVIVRHSSGGSITDYYQRPRARYAKLPVYVPDERRGYRQLPRQCTKEFKVEPCDIAIRSWLHQREFARKQKNGLRAHRDVYVTVALGFGADEAYRVNRKPFPVQWKVKSFPLYERGITTAALMQWYQDKGLPVPGKSACKICPYHDDLYWLDMRDNRPLDWTEVCDYDDWQRSPDARSRVFRGVRDLVYLHPSCTPLREVDFANWRATMQSNISKYRRNTDQLELALKLEAVVDCASDGAFSCMS